VTGQSIAKTVDLYTRQGENGVDTVCHQALDDGLATAETMAAE
jgi:hypothetical protein